MIFILLLHFYFFHSQPLLLPIDYNTFSLIFKHSISLNQIGEQKRICKTTTLATKKKLYISVHQLVAICNIPQPFTQRKTSQISICKCVVNPFQVTDETTLCQHYVLYPCLYCKLNYSSLNSFTTFSFLSYFFSFTSTSGISQYWTIISTFHYNDIFFSFLEKGNRYSFSFPFDFSLSDWSIYGTSSFLAVVLDAQNLTTAKVVVVKATGQKEERKIKQGGLRYFQHKTTTRLNNNIVLIFVLLNEDFFLRLIF